MPKISVIVPVYNTEQYLEKCISSIANQTLKDIEILVVNDGSTDNSLQVLEELGCKYKINIFNKLNSGAAAARKYGLERANSELIAFIDSDDYIEKNYLKKLLTQLEITDTNICCAREAYHPNLPLIRSIPLKTKRQTPNIDLSKNKKFLFLMSVNTNAKLFKRDYIDITDKAFKANVDLSLNYYLYAQARKISFANNATYHYVPNGKGLVSTYICGYSWDKIKNTLLPLSNLKELFISGNLFDEYYNELEQIFIKNIFQRTDYITNNLKDTDERNALINTLYDYLSFHFPNWQNNIYLQNNFQGSELPYIISAKRNKKYVLNYVNTSYANEQLIFNRYESVSSKVKQKKL